ncbi:MAG: RNase P subunit p30 family protein [Desulfurococcaceae archaeon]
MPRFYIDFYVKKCDERTLTIASKLGYRALVCEQLLYDEQPPLEVYRKKVIDAEDVSSLKRTLSSLDHRKHVVSVAPRSLEVARWASHDTRVDTIMLTLNTIELFDKKQFSTMSYYGKPVEIDLNHILDMSIDTRGAVFRRINLLLRNKTGLIVGSGADSWKNLFPPYVMVKLLQVLFDVPESLALLSVTDFPRQVVTRKDVATPNTTVKSGF